LDVQIDTRGQRLLDVLNDNNTSFLSVNEARVFRRGCATAVATLPQAVIRKANVALAILVGDRHEAPLRRSRSFVPKRRHSVFLVVLGYEVRGELSLKRTGDSVAALCHELGVFFPVPNGTVAFTGTHWEAQAAQVVIANSSHLSLLQLGKPVTHSATSCESHKSGAAVSDQNAAVTSALRQGIGEIQPE
jgi:hypothetical protein